MKGLWKFQVDIPKNARVTAVQSLENLHTFTLYSVAAMLVGKRVPTCPFSHITEQKILQLLWPITLFSLVQISLNLVERHVPWSHRLYQNLGQFDYDLHSYAFDDIICKPPI